jgi:hypothetical protein
MFAGSSNDRIGGSWLSTASERAALGIAVGIGVLTFCAIGAADWLMFDAGLPPFGIMLGSAALAAVLAFGFANRMAHLAHERHEAVNRELRIIGDTNHHIRNALELIQLSAQTTQNQEVIGQISTAVDRIQWVLRELTDESTFYPARPNISTEKVQKENNQKVS